jgi:PRTRC genetic system protein C
MALTVESLERVFVYKRKGEKEINLKDIGVNTSAREVVKFYSGTYPELTTCTLEGPILKDGKQIFNLIPSTGTKG